MLVVSPDQHTRPPAAGACFVSRPIAAELTPEERAEFESRYRERVDDWRPVLSGPAPATDRLTRPDFGAPGGGGRRAR